MNFLLTVGRYRFYWWHLLISCAVFGLGVILVVIWYPLILLKELGAIEVLAWVAVLQVGIWPLVAMLIYKEKKKTLKIDLVIIILVQCVMFGYGLRVLSQGRPAWIVYDGGNFFVIRANDVSGLKSTQKEPVASGWRPKFAKIRYTDDMRVNTTQDLTQEKIYYPALYQELNAEDLKRSGFELRLLHLYNSQNDIDRTLRKYPNATAWLPLSVSTSRAVVVLLNSQQGKIVGIVNLSPWKQ